MLKLILILALCLHPLAGFAAGKFSYDHFYESDAAFKKLDAELNASFKKLMAELPWHEKNILLDEQRKWHGKLFPLMVEDRALNKKPVEAARAVLKARVDDLEKLLDSGSADNILGMPISFGLSRSAVAEKLGLNNPAILDAGSDQAQDGSEAYKIKLFGENVPVYFTFERTKIVAPENDAAAFAAFASKNLGESPRGNAVELTALYAATTGDMPNREDYTILNEELGKKYKMAYPQYPPLTTFLESGDFAYSFDDRDFVNPSSQYVYEDKKRYIIVNGSWGTLDGGFTVTYLSRPYASLHIQYGDALVAILRDTGRYGKGLAVVPESASLPRVIYAIGDGELTWERAAGEYYTLLRDYQGGNMISVAMTPDDRAFAVTISYEDDGAFEEALIKNLTKKYDKLQDTPGVVSVFLGHLADDDMDFQTEDNFIHIGKTPHFATQHELTIISKKEAAKYAKVREAANEAARERDEERAEKVREESSRF